VLGSGRVRGLLGKKEPSGLSRTADEPGQTVNVDLCFVPATHAALERLPAVSGSSGRLVLCARPPPADGAEPTWPGQVFEDPHQEYATAMQTFVATAAPRLPVVLVPPMLGALRTEEGLVLRGVRRQVRLLSHQRGDLYQQRLQEDAAWQVVWRAHRVALRSMRRTPAERAAATAQEVLWHPQRRARHAVLTRRKEDSLWHQERHRLHALLAPTLRKRTWLAILVLTDNCSRQCLGLPLFLAGPKITATLVVAALRALLPPDLQFLISDRGTQCTAHEFAQFANQHSVVHVLVARHRPESNGIAERFVRTLKDWLAAQVWTSTDDLAPLLETFHAAYTARPHQGLPLPGLSPAVCPGLG